LIDEFLAKKDKYCQDYKEMADTIAKVS